MSTNPNQGQVPDPSTNQYGGYTGYTPKKSTDDPYGAYRPQGDAQQPGPVPQQPGGDPNYVYGQQPGPAGQQQQQYQYGAGQPGQQQQYQYGTYQPPQSVSGKGNRGNSGATEPTSLGIQARLEALLSYVVGPFTGIIFFFLERKNRFVRYNAAQSIVVFGPVFVLYVILQLISHVWLIGALLSPLIGCLTSILFVVFGLLWLFLMIQSYRGIKVKLPVAGDYAESLLLRFSKKGSI